MRVVQNSNITTASVVRDETGASKKEHPLKTTFSNPAANSPDFELANHGSLYLLCPLNEAAKNWMAEHLPMDSPETQFWGSAIVIEHRFISEIISGVQRDGLRVQVQS
jgi:hypothetical protein